MKKLQLIKEIDINGNVYYWSEYDGQRVTPYTSNAERAKQYFDEFKPIEPSKIIIEEREINL